MGSWWWLISESIVLLIQWIDSLLDFGEVLLNNLILTWYYEKVKGKRVQASTKGGLMILRQVNLYFWKCKWLIYNVLDNWQASYSVAVVVAAGGSLSVIARIRTRGSSGGSGRRSHVDVGRQEQARASATSRVKSIPAFKPHLSRWDWTTSCVGHCLWKIQSDVVCPKSAPCSPHVADLTDEYNHEEIRLGLLTYVEKSRK